MSELMTMREKLIRTMWRCASPTALERLKSPMGEETATHAVDSILDELRNPTKAMIWNTHGIGISFTRRRRLWIALVDQIISGEK